MNDFYREEILEHYRSPMNFGKLLKFNMSSRQLNPFCGDEIEIFVKFNKNLIKEIGFLGKGCAISIASASLLTEYAKNKTKDQLIKLREKDILSLLGIELSETRKKCAMLPFFVLKDCLK